MSSAARSLGFALVMCVACSLLLTAATTGLKPLQVHNVRIDKQKNILRSVALLAPGRDYTDSEVAALYKTNIQPVWVDAQGRRVPANQHGDQDLPLYLYTRNGKTSAYIIPVDTRGLWGPIKAYLALKSDGATVAGFTVFKHQETPGLGGEIEKQWFQKNFVGKKIRDADGNLVSVQVAKGKVAEVVPAAERANYVDGISGATLTGKYLSAGLKSVLSDYEPVAVCLRKKNCR
jgi:Na+-transporting NADH:ubiquinone oxidoreductase subunit C